MCVQSRWVFCFAKWGRESGGVVGFTVVVDVLGGVFGIQTLAVHSSRSPPPFPPNPPQPKRKTQFNPTGSHTSNLHAVASSEATCIDKAVPSHSRSSPPATIIFPPKGITLFFPPSETARGNMAGWDLWLFVCAGEEEKSGWAWGMLPPEK